MYKIFFTEEAERHINFFRKKDKQIVNKINNIENIIKTRKESIGKIERLKYKDFITYSRCITKFHRIVYTIDEDKSSVTIILLHGHFIK